MKIILVQVGLEFRISINVLDKWINREKKIKNQKVKVCNTSHVQNEKSKKLFHIETPGLNVDVKDFWWTNKIWFSELINTYLKLIID